MPVGPLPIGTGMHDGGNNMEIVREFLMKAINKQKLANRSTQGMGGVV